MRASLGVGLRNEEEGFWSFALFLLAPGGWGLLDNPLYLKKGSPRKVPHVGLIFFKGGQCLAEPGLEGEFCCSP